MQGKLIMHMTKASLGEIKVDLRAPVIKPLHANWNISTLQTRQTLLLEDLRWLAYETQYILHKAAL